MASFPELRLQLPSVSTEGFRIFRFEPAAAAALLLAVVDTASALLELATLQGYRAVFSTLDLPTRAPQFAALVGVPATARSAA